MDTRSLTYRELAQILGVKLDSARKTALRRRWKKLTGNDGTVRVIVPIDYLDRPKDKPTDSPPDNPEHHPAVLLARIDGLNALLAAAIGDRDHWRAQAQTLAARKAWSWWWTRPVVTNQ